MRANDWPLIKIYSKSNSAKEEAHYSVTGLCF